MKIKLIYLIPLCAAVMLLNLVGQPAFAQDPEAVVEEDPAIVVGPSGRLDITFDQEGRGTRQLSGQGGSQTYNIRIPGNFQILPEESYLDLRFSHIPSIPDKPSRLDIAVRDGLIATVPITEGNAAVNTTRIPLPPGAINIGRNQMRFSLDTSGTCEDPGAVVNATIDGSSLVSFAYEQFAYPTDLSLYPFPFTEVSLLDIPTTLVLPDLPTSNDLSAAATLAAGLGQEAGTNINLNTITYAELTPEIRENNHLIAIGTPQTNLLISELDLPLDIDESIIQPGYGVLEEIVSPWNEYRVILVVSGLDDEGVGKASIGLNRRAHFLGMRGPVAIVVELGELPTTLPDVATDSFKFEDRGFENQVIYGTRPQVNQFEFFLPSSWTLDAPPFFQLNFAHADTLDPTQSSIDISLNGLPLGSALLTPENRENGEIIVPIPASQLRAGRNTLSILVDTHVLGGTECSGETDRRVWTLISNQSEVFLPYVAENVAPTLNSFPVPFGQASGIEQTYFVLPDQPNSTLINQVVQLALRVGSVSRSEKLTIPVAYASEVDDTIRENYHLLVLGRNTENSLIGEINDQLPHPFIPNTNVLQPLILDQIVFLADSERDAGYLQMIESPWNEALSLLVVTGTTEEGIRLASDSLALNRRGIRGNLVVVEPVLAVPGAEVDPEADVVAIYAVDTQAVIAAQNITSDEPSDDPALSSTQTIGLSERWWK